MSTVVVYMFLLDHLPGFNTVLNDTIITNTLSTVGNFTPNIKDCDPKIADKIFSAVIPVLEQQNELTFRQGNNDLIASNDVSFNEISQEKNDLSEYKLREKDREEFFEEPLNNFDNYSEEIGEIKYHVYPVTEIKAKEKNATELKKLIYPENAPFLVAIFETLSNVTACICAGTLISPRWIITAASCLNILGKLYADNKDMMSHISSYSVVAGVSDPLLEGLVHNVTTIVQYQDNIDDYVREYRNGFVEASPYLAMMRIEPEIHVMRMPIIEKIVTNGSVVIYGWVLTKDASNLDSFVLMSITALILSISECQAHHSYHNTDVICLFNNDTETNITELSSGGPVLMMQGGDMRMLAVVQTDMHVFIAYPLHVYYNWINNTINDKV